MLKYAQLSNMLAYSLVKFWQSSYKNDFQVRLNFIISLVLNLALIGILYYKIHPFSYLAPSGDIPLHFNTYFGIDIYAKWYTVFILPLSGLLVILINNALGYMLYAKEKILTQFLIYTQTAVSLVLFASGIFTILLNI